eukprot:c40649_g1_i1.p1 GENE.c40649_g1_i1~~c40649_g1_i1.p1  ORF type:complete len:204 (+),score=37.76 c40649_g1_i1:35-646(+)
MGCGLAILLGFAACSSNDFVEMFGIKFSTHETFNIDLRSSQLSGSIPSQVGMLSNLWEWDMSNNRIGGELPSQVGMLTNLQHWNLLSNSLSGSIPIQVGRLTALTYLILGNNSLSGSIPSQVGQLAALESLGLGDNRLSGSIPSQFGKLTALKALYVREFVLIMTVVWRTIGQVATFPIKLTTHGLEMIACCDLCWFGTITGH